MTTTRTALSLFSILTIAFISFGQEKSDYATVQRFESRYKAILKSINEAQTVQDCGDISATITDLETGFQGDKALLDKSLYPDTFDERVLKARVQLRVIQEKIGVIESQVVRIAELETKVRELSAQVEKLSGENTQLLGDVKRLSAGAATGTAAIDSLKSVIAKLQSNLRDRDNMIFALVDSLFLQYDKDVTTMKDAEKTHIAVKVDRNNVLSNVKKSIQDNLQFLESTQLTGSDLSKMLKEHGKFASQWRGLGPKLANLYLTGKNKKQELAAIDTMLGRWSEKVGIAFWRAANATFKDNGIPVKQFDNGSQFVENLSAYIDEEIKNPKKESDDARYKKFSQFDEKIWKGEVGSAWIPMMTEQGKITEQQKKDIGAKVEQWRSSASPPSFALYAAIFILVVAMLAALFVRMRKSKD